MPDIWDDTAKRIYQYCVHSSVCVLNSTSKRLRTVAKSITDN